MTPSTQSRWTKASNAVLGLPLVGVIVLGLGIITEAVAYFPDFPHEKLFVISWIVEGALFSVAGILRLIGKVR